MPQHRESRRPLLYTFIICQLLLNVTFSNAAVIRRDKRQISTVSGTEAAPLYTEVETVKPTTESESGFLAEKEDHLIDWTTAGSEKNTYVTTGARHVGDAWNEEEYEVDDEDGGSSLTETTLKSNRIESAPNVDSVVDTTDKRDVDFLFSTVSSGEFNENDKTTIRTDLEGTTPTSRLEIESTSQVKIYSTTFSETGSTDDATDYRTDEALSTQQPETTGVSGDSTKSETDEPSTGLPLEVISTTIVNSGNAEKSKADAENALLKSRSSDADLNSIVTTTTSTDAMTEYSTTDDSKLQTSTKAIDETTVTIGKEESKSKDDRTTILADETTAMPIKEQSKPLTPTFKSDDSRMMFLTSTETFDEDGAQTTFQASPLIREPSVSLDEKNSSISSAEKRGKFIDDNYSYLNELRSPNTSNNWGLAGIKIGEKGKSAELQNSVETSDEKAVNHSMVTKSLLDWTRVMMSTDAMASETTAKMSELMDSTVTSLPTETSVTQENEVQTSTMTPITTDMVNLANRIDSTAVGENEVVTNVLETTTTLAVKETVATTPDRLSVDDTSLPQTDDVLSTTITSASELLAGKTDVNIENNQVELEDTTSTALPITTTTESISPILATTTMKSETINSPVNGETTEEQNTGTILTSSVSLIDFTTSIPFLTPTTVTTTTTTASTEPSTTPENAFIMDDRTNETPDMESTLIPEQVTTTTPSPTTPAVTVIAATTDETQKTETEAHTPAIISNDTAQQNETHNNNNDDDDVEVSSETPTTATNTKSADSSSREAFEASTRVEPNLAASTAKTRTHTAEVNSLDDSDESTESNFESSNTYYGAASPSTSTTTVGGILKFVTDNHSIAAITTATSRSTSPQDDLERIDSIQKIADRGETSIESNVIDPLQAGEASTTTTTTPSPPVPTATTTTTTTTTTSTTTEKSEDNMRMPSTDRGWVTEDSSSTMSTTTTTTTPPGPSYDDTTTPLQSISTNNEDLYSIVPQIDNGGGFHVPMLNVDDTTSTMSGVLAAGAGLPMDTSEGQETDVNVIIAISVSVVGIVALILLVAFLYVMRKRQKQMSYGQRCRPVSLDAYSLDNVSVYNSVRRKGAALRASKRSYGNVAFDDPSLRHNVLGTHELAKFVEKKSSIWDEFKDVPQIIARADEVPAGCEDKNRYANVIPLPETRVILQQQNGDEKTEYINANYVRGPKDSANYYIACQAPLETTVIDFWRMIWEQNSRVIIMATDLIENGIDKCAEYLPPSVTLDNHTVFGDFQVTLKNREVKEKYAISTLMLKNNATDESREITHYWYQWPETGVPTDEAAVIAMLLEARSSLKAYAIEQSDNKIDTIIAEENQTSKKEINGNVTSEKTKPPAKDQGPLTIHCSPGTGRTGTILACDIAMRCLEEPKRCVDIPQIVYSVRRGRASSVQTKEQYEFIYKITHVYATKISNLNSDN